MTLAWQSLRLCAGPVSQAASQPLLLLASIARLSKHIKSRSHLSNHKRHDVPLCCSGSDNTPIVNCRYETLTALLESNELGTVSEFNVFLAAMRWVDADESREHFLDEVLGLVRFPTMDYEELGLVGKHPTAAGAGILKVCPMLLTHLNQLLPYHRLGVIAHAGERGSRARNTKGMLHAIVYKTSTVLLVKCSQQ